jgi:hypothetical protein
LELNEELKFLNRSQQPAKLPRLEILNVDFPDHSGNCELIRSLVFEAHDAMLLIPGVPENEK